MNDKTLSLVLGLAFASTVFACGTIGDAAVDGREDAVTVHPTGNVTGIRVVLPAGMTRKPKITVGELDYGAKAVNGALLLGVGTYCVRVVDSLSPDYSAVTTERCGITVKAGALTDVKLGTLSVDTQQIAALAAQKPTQGGAAGLSPSPPGIEIDCPSSIPRAPLQSSVSLDPIQSAFATNPATARWIVVDQVQITAFPYGGPFPGWSTTRVTTTSSDTRMLLDTSDKLSKIVFDLEPAELPTNPFAAIQVTDPTLYVEAPTDGKPLAFWAVSSTHVTVTAGDDARTVSLSKVGSQTVHFGRLDVDDVAVTDTAGVVQKAKGTFTVQYVGVNGPGPVIAFARQGKPRTTELETGTGLWLYPGTYHVTVTFQVGNSSSNYEEDVRLQ